MKNNYPIKYAIMPIYEQVGWSHGLNELEQNYDVVAYIVSKCFVVNDTTKYEIDGKSKRECQVVFPYRNDDFGTWIRTEPRFGFHNQVINSVVVNDVYDSYEEALKTTELKNEEILERKITYLPFDEKFHETVTELRQNHEIKLSTYKNIEKQIEQNTFDLVINDIPNDQTIVIVSEDESKIVKISLYDYIRFYGREKFYVCNVSKEHFELIKKQIKANRKIDEEKLGIISKYLLASDPENKIIRIVDFDSKKEKGCFYLTKIDERLKYDENMTKFYQEEREKFVKGMKVYTIETYEDIIKSYISKFISKSNEPIEIDGKVIRKKLVLK